jgi:hypothetical protein
MEIICSKGSFHPILVLTDTPVTRRLFTVYCDTCSPPVWTRSTSSCTNVVRQIATDGHMVPYVALGTQVD